MTLLLIIYFLGIWTGLFVGNEKFRKNNISGTKKFCCYVWVKFKAWQIALNEKNKKKKENQ